MAVAETFLRGGRPVEDPSRFADYAAALPSTDATWHIVVAVPAMWSADPRHFCLFQPLLTMLFISPRTAADDPSQWRLALLHNAMVRDGALSTAFDACMGAWRAAPTTTRAATITVRVDDRTPPHAPRSPLHGITGPAAALAGLLRTNLEDVDVQAQQQSLSVEALVSDVVRWACAAQATLKTPLRACAFPPLSPLLRSCAATQPERTTSVVTRLIKLGGAASVLACGRFSGDGDCSSKAQVRSSEPPLCCTALDLRAALGDAASDCPADWAVTAAVLLQRPSQITNSDPSYIPQGSDALEAAKDAAGPLRGSWWYPSGAAVEVYLHQDPADALHCCRRTAEPHGTDWYEDTLHPVDGVVVGRFGPPHGVAFEDIAFFAAEAAERGVDPEALALPRLFARKPRGTAERRTPVENPHMLVDDTAVPSLAALERAVAALEAITAMADRAGEGTALEWSLRADAPAAERSIPCRPPQCAWCGRPRLSMSRCGGCRAVFYCCSRHQTQDWKGGHKAECKLAAAAREDAEAVAAVIAGGGGCVSLEQSDAATVRHVLGEVRARCNRPARVAAPSAGRRVVVHLVGVDASAREEFIACLAMELAVHGCSAFDPAMHRHSAGESSDAALEEESLPLRELRFIVAGDRHTEQHMQHAEVYRSGVVLLSGGGSPAASSLAPVAPTRVLGDLWYERGDEDRGSDETATVEGTCTVVVRWCTERYHHFMAKFADEPSVVPDVVVCLGGRSADGLTFFSGIAEALQDLYGTVPIVDCEATRLACHRTLGALEARASMVAPSTAAANGGSPQPKGRVVEVALNAATLSRVAINTSNGQQVHPNSFVAMVLPPLP